MRLLAAVAAVGSRDYEDGDVPGPVEPLGSALPTHPMFPPDHSLGPVLLATGARTWSHSPLAS